MFSIGKAVNSLLICTVFRHLSIAVITFIAQHGCYINYLGFIQNLKEWCSLILLSSLRIILIICLKLYNLSHWDSFWLMYHVSFLPVVVYLLFYLCYSMYISLFYILNFKQSYKQKVFYLHSLLLLFFNVCLLYRSSQTWLWAD